MKSNAIILFDGVCNLCDGAIAFVIKRDPKKYFRFASLQSETAQKLLGERHSLDTMILIENGNVYLRSTAALRIAKKLRGLWPLFYIFIVIPKFLRDLLYNWIARNRYRWFGKIEACMVLTPELRDRFL